jgi:hypothetical protein
MLAAPDSYSPSAQKPRHVLAAWQEAGLPVTVNSFMPVDEADLGLAHDPTYVRDILDGKPLSYRVSLTGYASGA